MNSHLGILCLPGFITLLHANIFLLFTFLHLWSQYFGILKKEGGKFIFLDSLIFIKIKNNNIKIYIIKSQNIKWKIERNKLYKNNQIIYNLLMDIEIKNILEEHELYDLKSFIIKRKCVNHVNLYLIYFFHLVQSTGILITTIAAGSDDKTLIWVGIGLNLLASLINVYEKINNTMLKKLMNDIKSIKDGKYLVESQLIDIPETIKNTTEGTPLLTQINNLQEPLLQKNTT